MDRNAMMTPEAFRRLALSLPEAHEKETWGEATFRVRDKIFATLGPDGVDAGLKASLEAQAALVNSAPEVFSIAHYTGRYGWIGVKLARVDDDELRELVIESWRLIAPKKLVAAFDAGAGSRAT
jgi:hypothetical protein